MADWRSVALKLALADGKIDNTETKIIKKALFADGKIDKSELEFLNELRKKAKKTSKDFQKLFMKSVMSNVLADGEISAAEAAWLRKAIFADKKVDADEKKLLKGLRKGAKKTSPEFDQLCADCKV
jgi:uncharacterized tellurite resistance protein B-like protein